MTRPDADRRATGPAWVLTAGVVSAVVAWLSLTMVPLLSQAGVAGTTLAVLLAAVVIGSRHRGRQRWLALSGGFVALLPLLVVAAFLSVSDG